jgi:general secretion pathway protein C
MTSRLLSFAVWALVAAGVVFWVMRLLNRSEPAPAHAVTAAQSAPVASADVSRVLGSTRPAAAAETATAPPPAADARFRLVGVVAAKASAPRTGLALIAVDGKPPRPVGLGGVVDGSLVLLAVNHRRAELGPAGGSATVKLDLPITPEPNRATRLPSVPAAVGALQQQAPAQAQAQAPVQAQAQAEAAPVAEPASSTAPGPGTRRNPAASR